MNTFYRISLIVVLFFVLVASQLSANEDTEKIVKDLPRLLGSTNEGTEFFMTFHPIKEEPSEKSPIKIYITSAYATQVVLEIPGREIYMQKTTIPNGVIEFDLSSSKGQCYQKTEKDPPQSQKVFKGYGIIITSEAPILCYGSVNTGVRSEGYLAIPKKSLGKSYIVSSYNDPSQDDGERYLTSYTSIVGVYDKTDVKIKLGGRFSNYTPGDKPLKTGDRATQRLNRGDVWLIGTQGDYSDLTGTTVEANKPVAVISGTYCAYVPIQYSSCNYLIEQDLPMESWGRKYHIAPIINRTKASIIRMFTSEPVTHIYRNGIEWSLIKAVGGAEISGYAERRFVSEGEELKPVTITALNPITVTQYNTGKTDDVVENSPFQMALTPVEQYQKSLKWCMPGTKEGAPFHKNYLNLIYKSTGDGQIPYDLEFGKVENGVMKWTQLSEMVNDAGLEITDPDVKDSRYYHSLTITLDSIGVYGMRGNEPMAGYIYGYGDSLNSYGYPVSVSVNDLRKADTEAPLPTYAIDCQGQVQGNVIEQPEDELYRSNLAEIYQNIIEGFNFSNIVYDVANFNPGETDILDWSLNVIDKDSDAKAILTFSDRAGNDTTITIEYNPIIISAKDKIVDWGRLKITDLPESRTVTFKNESSKPIVIDSIFILSSDKSQDFHYSGFTIDTTIYKSNGGILPGYNLQPGEEFSFNITFDASTVKSDFNGGKKQFIDSIGIKANWFPGISIYCYSKYLTAVIAQIAYPCITTGSLDFWNVLINQTKVQPASIFNNGISPLTITGYRYVYDNSDGAYEISLGEISHEKPLQINPGSFVVFTITFKPKALKDYSNTITFESDAIRRCTDHDPNLELDGRGTNLLIEPIEDVFINMNSFADVPIVTNSTKPTALVFKPYTGNSGIISVDSIFITGSNNSYNLQLIPKKDKTGILNISISADDGIRKGSTNCKVTVIDPGAVQEATILDNNIFVSPNPANTSSVNIHYNLEYDCNVELSLFNSSGMLISNLLNKYQTAGNQSFSLPINEFAAGIYFVEFRACGLIGHKSVVIVK